jgi:hypothetical protein
MVRAATYEGTTKGMETTTIHRPANRIRVLLVIQAVAVPITSEVAVTAVARTMVDPNSWRSRSAGIITSEGFPATWIRRLTGGISTETTMIPAASHQP